MNENMEPVLSDEEWAIARDDDSLDDVVVGKDAVAYVIDGVLHVADQGHVTMIDQPAKLLALLNDVLPSDHPAKITHEAISTLRNTLDRLAEFDEDDAWAHLRGMLRPWADALETYLPKPGA